MSDAPDLEFAPYEGEIVAPARTTSPVAASGNPFEVARSEHLSAGAVEIASRAAAAGVQGRMVIAKQFPRDEGMAYAKVMQACQRLGLADVAIYSYDRGGSKVEGPSIRLAEELARHWGNIDFGLNELSRRPGESEMEAYAWDLQTNTQSSQRFTVKHLRDVRSGPGKPLTSERDIYEITANNGSRRTRARILAILPPELVDDAVAACRATVKRGNGQSLGDRIRILLREFNGCGVTAQMLVDRLEHPIDQITPDELVTLRGVLTVIKDGAPVRDHFGPKVGTPPALPAGADGFEAAAAGASVSPPSPPPQPAPVASAAQPQADLLGADTKPLTAVESALSSLLDNLRRITTSAALADMLANPEARVDIETLASDQSAQGEWLRTLDAHRAQVSGKGRRS